MPVVEDVRLILERTFGVPVAESDAQIVLDRLNELASKEVRPITRAVDWAKAGEDYTVKATFENGKLLSERIIRPATNANC